MHWQEWSVTFDGDLRFRRFFRRSKAETQGFPTVKESSKTDITIKSYGPTLLNCSNLVPNEESNIELQNAIRRALLKSDKLLFLAISRTLVISGPACPSCPSVRRRVSLCQGVIKVQTQLQLLTFNTFTTFKDPVTWAPRCQFGRPNTRLKALDEANPARESRYWDRISTTYKSLPGNYQHEIIHRKSYFLNF